MTTPLCTSTCTMTLLTPLINPEKLKCVQDGVAALKATTYLTSAWRPREYQRHLNEIINADKVLTEDLLQSWPGCKKLREKVTKEMNKHGLKSGQAVAPPGMSRHESGQAFDITINGITDEQRATYFPSNRQENVVKLL
ncbi:unnamed protein product [Rotaria sordida]|uniref:D-alanyl-D-alanine carboxypeptidase-like core domain-containing protein n=1 Tax=Rotaria sordida TaxID=392033 RepID=A0A815DXD0_9BILA|nr:unnamed protein product [Rotaria sordida]CAF1303923.1 unnamed protein product [Rotaria sordida]